MGISIKHVNYNPSNNNSYANIYTVPAGKIAKVYIDKVANISSGNVDLYIYYGDENNNFIQGNKFNLSNSDTAVRGGTLTNDSNGVSLTTASSDTICVGADESYINILYASDNAYGKAKSIIAFMFLNENYTISVKSSTGNIFINLTIIEEDIQ